MGFAAVPRGIQEGYHCFFAGAAESDVPASAPAAASLTGEAAKEMPDRFNLPHGVFLRCLFAIASIDHKCATAFVLDHTLRGSNLSSIVRTLEFAKPKTYSDYV